MYCFSVVCKSSVFGNFFLICGFCGKYIAILLKENLLTDSKTLKKYIKETKNLKEELILSN